MDPGLSLAETIARFLDERVDLADRRTYAYRLAREGSPGAIAALLKVLRTAPPEHKAFMAQLIGSTRNPAVKAWLWPLLEDGDERVRRGVMRGLSAVGGEDVTRQMAGILADEHGSGSLRIEAALALGTLATPAARDALLEALARTPSAELTTQILHSLGEFEFPAVAQAFERYLAAPETPRRQRVAAVEALASSSAEGVPFLLSVVRSDRDAEVRASAAWAISGHETVRDIGPALADLAEKEPEPDVRRRLYEALLPQTGIPAGRLLPLVQAESDLAARVAGLNALGRAAQQEPQSGAAMVFDRDMVPELIRIAPTRDLALNGERRGVGARPAPRPDRPAVSGVAPGHRRCEPGRNRRPRRRF